MSEIAQSTAANFFSTQTSPSNWALNKVSEDKPAASRGMVVVAFACSLPSAIKHLSNFAVKFFVALYATTIGQIPAVKEKTWEKLEKHCLVSNDLKNTWADLAKHIYKCVMFMAVSPLCNLFAGIISPFANKRVHDALRLTTSYEKKEPENSQNLEESSVDEESQHSSQGSLSQDNSDPRSLPLPPATTPTTMLENRPPVPNYVPLAPGAKDAPPPPPPAAPKKGWASMPAATQGPSLDSENYPTLSEARKISEEGSSNKRLSQHLREGSSALKPVTLESKPKPQSEGGLYDSMSKILEKVPASRRAVTSRFFRNEEISDKEWDDDDQDQQAPPQQQATSSSEHEPVASSSSEQSKDLEEAGTNILKECLREALKGRRNNGLATMNATVNNAHVVRQMQQLSEEQRAIVLDKVEEIDKLSPDEQGALSADLEDKNTVSKNELNQIKKRVQPKRTGGGKKRRGGKNQRKHR